MRRVERCRGVFRIAHGRVLVHRPDGAVAELAGPAAAVWLAADEPGTAGELAARVAEAGAVVGGPPPATADLPDDLLADLCTGGWLVDVSDD